jgi:hypothetical protein
MEAKGTIGSSATKERIAFRVAWASILYRT